MNLKFAPIDCKDSELIRVKEIRNIYDRPTNSFNIKVMMTAQKEYIEKLYALQQEIQQKYGDQFVQENPKDKLDVELESTIQKEVFGDSKDKVKYDKIYYT